MALALLLLSITICMMGISNTNAITEQMTATVQQAKSAQQNGDREAAYRLSKKATEDWRGAHSILCVYMVHSDLEAIDQTLATLPELCRNDAEDAFLSECDRGLTQISYLKESEIPNIDNIF